MELDRDACYRALRTRDARFDGRFFTAVRSTGIYCRPVCPAPAPKPENCLFVPSAAAAQELGFRPCLRCRPEASPGTPNWLGTSAAVSRALRLISSGALDGGTLDDLAARLGMGARHLRRLFLRHLGASPVAVAHTRRMLFAKKLIDETRLPMSEIALAAGFSSVRRFNDAILKTYDRAPRRLRQHSDSAAGGAGLELELAYRPPFDWNAFARYLSPRVTPGVESVGEAFYRRTIRLDGVQGWVEVRPVPGANHLAARLELTGSRGLIRIAERLRRIFDLGADPQAIAEQLGSDARLGPIVGRSPSVRVPGAWDGFELAVRAILGQQITVRGATTLAGRLAATFGEKLEPRGTASLPEGLSRLFPEPADLVDADLTTIGLTRSRAAAIVALARAVAAGEVSLDVSTGLEETVEKLGALPGIGAWTAHYIAMRGLREPDAFPAGDLGLRRSAATNGDRPLTEARLLQVAEAWRPWRAYAAMYLWLSDPTPTPRARTRRNHEARV